MDILDLIVYAHENKISIRSCTAKITYSLFDGKGNLIKIVSDNVNSERLTHIARNENLDHH